MNLSSRQRRLLLAAGLPVVLLACALMLLPALARRSNCGGSSAALTACRSVVVCLRLIQHDRGDKPVSVATLAPPERRYFEQIAGSRWLGDAKLLVTTSTVNIPEGKDREIIAVCDRPFDNVPRRWFGKAPLTHAVAYADGTTSLISPAEFRRLDREHFVDVRTILGGKADPAASVTNHPAAVPERVGAAKPKL